MRERYVAVRWLAACAGFMASTACCPSASINEVFRNRAGDTIVLSLQPDAVAPDKRQHVIAIEDCSNDYPWGFKDKAGFAFSHVKHCNDIVGDEGKTRLSYRPLCLAALHEHTWIVFDSSPNYLFHYAGADGLVGIYVGPTPSYDFRSLFRRKDFRPD